VIERFGGQPRVAPSMREIPLEDNPLALQSIRKIIADEFDIVILLTGVGTEALFDVARSDSCLPELLDAFKRVQLVIRGPKPAAALKKVGLSYDLKAPEPNTWRELIAVIDNSDIQLSGKQVAVQEYGLPNEELSEQLMHRGASVTAVPVYRWGLPEDLAPLKLAIREIVQGEHDVALFTSAQQVVHVLQIAAEEGLEGSFRSALQSLLVASIGPTCSESLKKHKLPVHVEASPPKMASLVRQAISAFENSAASQSP